GQDGEHLGDVFGQVVFGVQIGSITGAFAESERQNARYAQSQADDAGQDRHYQEIHDHKLRRTRASRGTEVTFADPICRGIHLPDNRRSPAPETLRSVCLHYPHRPHPPLTAAGGCRSDAHTTRRHAAAAVPIRTAPALMIVRNRRQCAKSSETTWTIWPPRWSACPPRPSTRFAWRIRLSTATASSWPSRSSRPTSSSTTCSSPSISRPRRCSRCRRPSPPICVPSSGPCRCRPHSS